jgi:heme-degrading monooxygenase HmoA
LLVVVISVLRLHVRPGIEQALIRFYVEHEIFERSRESGGFRGGRLLEPVEPETAFLVIAEWDDADAYRRWLASPVRAELGVGLEPLLGSEPPEGAIYREAVSSEAVAAPSGESREGER